MINNIHMECPKCKGGLETIGINGVKADYCRACGGLWFDKDELKTVRDRRDENLSWLDFDLWRDKNKLEVSGKYIDCPRDGKPLFKIKYGGTDIMVDVCLDCRGIWLDREELNKIVAELEDKINSETIPQYLNDLGREVAEIIGHPDHAKTDLKHIAIIMKLLEYRLAAQHPKIAEITSVLPH